jgi:hypothetical protein
MHEAHASCCALKFDAPIAARKQAILSPGHVTFHTPSRQPPGDFNNFSPTSHHLASVMSISPAQPPSETRPQIPGSTHQERDLPQRRPSESLATVRLDSKLFTLLRMGILWGLGTHGG